ncbi:MAG: DUF393 domain-containing protein [Pseudomonadota bacterium]
MLTLLYDGLCPLCCLEIHFLQQRNTQNNLQFIDIRHTDFKEEEWGVKIEDLMAIIHARKPDGSYIKGVDVFIASYQAIGLQRLTQLVQVKSVRFLADKAYIHFAKHRQTISKILSPFIYIIFYLKGRRALKNSQRCKEGLCELQ